MTLVVDWVVKPQYQKKKKKKKKKKTTTTTTTKKKKKKKNNKKTEESDQTGQMLRQILFFAGRTYHYIPANFCLFSINTSNVTCQHTTIL